MVVELHNLLQPGIDHETDVGDRDRRLRHVRRQDDLPLLLVLWCKEGVPLLRGFDGAMERHDPQRRRDGRRLQTILASLNIVPATYKHEDGALVVGRVPARSPNGLKINKETTHESHGSEGTFMKRRDAHNMYATNDETRSASRV